MEVQQGLHVAWPSLSSDKMVQPPLLLSSTCILFQAFDDEFKLVKNPSLLCVLSWLTKASFFGMVKMHQSTILL